MKNKKFLYEEPIIEVLQVEVEAGFAASNIEGGELPGLGEGEPLNAIQDLNDILLNQW